VLSHLTWTIPDVLFEDGSGEAAVPPTAGTFRHEMAVGGQQRPPCPRSSEAPEPMGGCRFGIVLTPPSPRAASTTARSGRRVLDTVETGAAP
jgi:hypothetical protein